MSTLVIVESPAKAKTIQKYLPDGYVVRASLGHIRDLPDNASQLPEEHQGHDWSSLGVNIDAGFEPVYVVKDQRSKRAISELRQELKDADELILATDEDREGEAISWHLIEALKPRVPIKRMVFHEITRSAIQEALEQTRELDMALVEAQETRRILDRLVGYPLSLLVSKKIRYGLSAGRVQSAAVRLLVEREEERRRFRKGSYWDLKAAGRKDDAPFDATLYSVDGTRLATGKDFDESTGRITEGRDVLLLDEERARALAAALIGKSWTVGELHEREYQTSPKPPFTTSTLQQEASRKLGMGAKRAMSVAQKLYESGFITYMRTDSTNLSTQAVDAARAAARKLYGDAYVPDEPRQYRSKAKNAQEAHEAIRPTGDHFTHPERTGLDGDEARLYDLIWKRTVACQMANARRTSQRADLLVDVDGQTLEFRAHGNRIDFPGYIRAYFEGSDDPEAALEDSETLLPPLVEGDTCACQKVEPVGHETKPPARFTEASLVRALEEQGVGHPSTYAAIMDKISSDERYARKEGKTLVPTFFAMAVTRLLDERFPELVDVRFTARMEDDLDEIAAGRGTKLDYLTRFYSQDGAFADKIERYEEEIKPAEARMIALDGLPFPVRVGRYGPYVQVEQGEEVQNVNVPDDVAPADLTMEHIQALLELGEQGPLSLGDDPATGKPVFLLHGPYGHYVQLGGDEEEAPEEGAKKKRKKKPPRASLPKGVEPDDVELDLALQLLSLPRLVGEHPETGVPIEAALGRYGPYVRMDKEYRNLPGFEQIFTITLEEALALVTTPKASRRSNQLIRELGADPASGDTVELLQGRYGPYVKLKRTNASLPKDADVDAFTLEQALALLQEKAQSKKGGKKGGRKKA